MFDFKFDIADEFCFKFDLTDQFEFKFDLIQLVTDPTTGQTRLFEGGYFRSDGVFVNSGSWDS